MDMKAEILRNAVVLAARVGFQKITREAVAVAAGTASGTVSYHWGTIDKLKTAIVQQAIASENVKILAGALSAGHHLAKAAPTALRERAARMIAG